MAGELFQWFVILLVFLGLGFLACSFVAMSFDPTGWVGPLRLIYALYACVMLVRTIYCIYEHSL